ncbi:serine/threonine-protein phosphatase 7 long form-like protein [Cucumis melo var. makuwa]|nr:serine/threonine-protein phosphatase 7 long form-like protein [Cucumis melo var. makuwa]
MQLDWHLITALVEHWRPETHTFLMPCGECTITLKDVEVKLRLPVDGKPLTGSLRYNWKVIYEDLLGVVLPNMKGHRLSLPMETLSSESCTVLKDRWPINAATGMSIRQIPHYSTTENAAAFRWSTFEFQSANMLLTYQWTFDRINWTPYTSNIMASLPLRCRSGQAV